jgi:DNA-binding NtrC family response regulator
MPGLDGLTLIREAQRCRPGLPAILLTGFATDTAELAMGGALSGTFSLLRKPVDAKALADRVAMLLEAKEAAVMRGNAAVDRP